VVLHFQNKEFLYRVVSNQNPEQSGTGLSWLSYCLDLNPYDYFLWGFLENCIFSNNPHTVEELKAKMVAAVESFIKETLAAVMENVT
jgi:hypothetical protein